MAVETCVRPKRGGSTSTETVITCTGDLTDPNFKRRFRSILKELRGIVCKGSDERLRVRKMEPWNSVRVTFSIGVEAAERLRALAEAGGEVLARLGILSVQLPNGQVISVRVSTPSTPPNVVAPAPSAIPPLVPPAGSSSGQQQPNGRFPFSSMAQASAIVSREAKTCLTQPGSHYPPPPYPEARQDPPQASPLLVNLLQTDQVVSSATPGAAGRPTAFTRPAQSAYQAPAAPPPPAAPGGKPPPPYSTSSAAVASLSSPPHHLQHQSRLPPSQAPSAVGVVSPHHTQISTPLNPLPSNNPHQEPSSSSLGVPGDSLPQTASRSLSNSAPSVSTSEQPPTQPQGKTVQYLINPLTGVLEPMVSSESESETEAPPVEAPASIVPPSRESPAASSSRPEPPPVVVKAEVVDSIPVETRKPLMPTSITPLIPVVSLQRHPIPINSQLPVVERPLLKFEPQQEEEDSRTTVTVKKEDLALSPPAATVPSVTTSSASTETEPVIEEERPKGEEKIKLRLKLDKTESSFNQYKASAENNAGNISGGGSSSSEPRVPPLHISLRGRPAVVSRKEKRKKEESTSPREKEREPLTQGTYEGTCQFPSEAEVASILRSMPPGGKLLNTTVTARRKREKKKVSSSIYPRSVPRVEEKLKKGSGSLLKSVVKSAAKEARMMTAQRSSKPLQNKKPTSPVLSNQSASVVSGKPSSGQPSTELDFKPEVNGTAAVVVVGSSVGKFKENGPISGGSSSSSSSSSGGSTGSTGDDSGIESMDALSEKSPNQSTSPLRKEDLPKKKEKEVEEVVPIRLTPALYTYSNPERQREDTPSPDHTEEERFGGKSLLEQLLIDIPNGDVNDRRPNSLRRSPEISPTIPNSGKRGRRPSESSSSDPPTPRPTKRKCSENANELIKACIDDGKRDVPPLPQGEMHHDSSDDEAKRKEEEEARLRLAEEKPAIRSTFNTRRSARQTEIREARPTRKSTAQPKKEEPTPAINATNKRRRNSKEK